MKCVHNSCPKIDSTAKPSTPVHLAKKCVSENTDDQHRVHRYSNRIQYNPQISPIVTTDRFLVLQDSNPSSDQKSLSQPSIMSDDRACKEQANAHLANRGQPVVYRYNTTSNTDQDCFVDTNKECDYVQPHIHTDDTVFQSTDTSIPQHDLKINKVVWTI